MGSSGSGIFLICPKMLFSFVQYEVNISEGKSPRGTKPLRPRFLLNNRSRRNRGLKMSYFSLTDSSIDFFQRSIMSAFRCILLWLYKTFLRTGWVDTGS